MVEEKVWWKVRDKVEQLEKENAELDNANTRLRESNFNLQKELNNQKFLNRQGFRDEVEKIFKDCREKPNIDIPQFHINAGEAITAICNLAIPQVRTSPFTDEQNQPKGDKMCFEYAIEVLEKKIEVNKECMKLCEIHCTKWKPFKEINIQLQHAISILQKADEKWEVVARGRVSESIYGFHDVSIGGKSGILKIKDLLDKKYQGKNIEITVREVKCP